MDFIMEHFKALNWLAILVAGLANFMVGALWYQQFTFGAKWAAAHGIDPKKAMEEGASMGKVMAIGFITTMITAIGAGILLSPFAVMGWKYGAAYGCMLGVFVIFFNLWKHNNFLMKPAAATIIDGAHDIVVFTAMGAIIGAWGM